MCVYALPTKLTLENEKNKQSLKESKSKSLFPFPSNPIVLKNRRQHVNVNVFSYVLQAN